MSSHFRFEDQVAVVTGGTRGIGRAVSLALAGEGARVVATFASDTDSAASICEEASDLPGSVETAQFDVGDAQAVADFWQSMAESRVDVLVSNAGIRRDALLAMMPREDWERVLTTNLTGAFEMAKGAMPAMLRERYGRVVFITSPSGIHGMKGQANYAASKAGIVGMAKSLCREVARKGITVNSVCPGFIQTEMVADLGPEQLREIRSLVAAARFGTPEEVAAAVLFLASRDAAYVNGALLEVTGGL